MELDLTSEAQLAVVTLIQELFSKHHVMGPEDILAISPEDIYECLEQIAEHIGYIDETDLDPDDAEELEIEGEGEASDKWE